MREGEIGRERKKERKKERKERKERKREKAEKRERSTSIGTFERGTERTTRDSEGMKY